MRTCWIWIPALLWSATGVAADEAAGGHGGQGGSAWTKGAGGGGDRPPADATPEERRAWWQKRAAARGASAEGGRPAEAAAASGRPGAAAGQGGGKPFSGKPAEGKPAEGRMAEGKPGGGRPGGMGGMRDGVFWLSDLPPQREGRRGGGRPGGGGMGGSGGMEGMGGMGGGRDSVPTKRLWLRMGGNPQTARGVPAEEATLLLGPDGMPSEVAVEAHGGPYNVTFPMYDMGYYNAYWMRQTVEGDTLNVNIAKAEVIRSAGHGGGDMAMASMPFVDYRVPVELVRDRKEKESGFTRLNYGDTVSFRVMSDGKPVQNARVTFTSGQGWSNSVQSDEDGRASFMVIRDYYPQDWNLFDKGHRETYLVSATYTRPESGEKQGAAYTSVRYTTTLSGAYYPGVKDYESYASGLMIGLTGLLFTGTGVYLYRRRRVKPYREARFDE